MAKDPNLKRDPYTEETQAAPVTSAGLQRLTPAEAADAIRDDIESNPATITDPAMQHRMRFVTEVCHYLSLEPTPVNVQRVVDALHDAGIEDGVPEEYPKWVTYERDGQWYGVAVQDVDEEALANANDWDKLKSPSQPVAAPRPKDSSKPKVEEHA